MKKLSLIMAMVLIATIGGVYATWNYSSETAQIYLDTTRAVAMADVSVSGESGKYQMVSNLASMQIDQNKDTFAQDDYHKALLMPLYTSGTNLQAQIRYVPSERAQSTEKDKGVTTYVWMSCSAKWKYNKETGFYDENSSEKDIFSLTYDEDNFITIHPVGTDISELESERNFVWQKHDDGYFYFDYAGYTSDREFGDIIEINNIVLSSANLNAAFGNQLKEVYCYMSNKTPSETVKPQS